MSSEHSEAGRDWYSRGYLPHCDRIGLLQAVTFRLADSLPQHVAEALEQELALQPDDRRQRERRRRIEAWLDSGAGCCALRHPEVARYVQDRLHFRDGDHYRLLAWCIMPNHVHVLLEPLCSLATIVQAWKSVSSRWILSSNHRFQLRIPDSDQLWMREYWDRYIRDEDHLQQAIAYIHNNPVKARLCQTAPDWPWSSARLAFSRKSPGPPTPPSASSPTDKT